MAEPTQVMSWVQGHSPGGVVPARKTLILVFARARELGGRRCVGTRLHALRFVPLGSLGDLGCYVIGPIGLGLSE